MSSSASAIGRAGEFLASYILETFGVEVHHVSRDGADLWCKMPRTTTIPARSFNEGNQRRTIEEMIAAC